MEFLAELLNMHGVAYALLVLGLAGAVGLALGNIQVLGVRLGIGGALFAGIAFGHFGVHIDPQVMDFTREFGLLLFVYTIGLQVGPGFFSALKKDGLALNTMAASIVLLGVAVAVLIHLVIGLPLPVVLGLFSGATTNTPSLAAATQVLTEVGATADQLALPGLGYAMSYPFGIIGILLSMMLIRALLKIDIGREAVRFKQEREAAFCPIEAMSLEIRNPNLVGLTLRQVPGLANMGVVLSRVAHDGSQEVAHPDHVIAEGDVVQAVGPHAKLEELRLILGDKADLELKEQPSDIHWERLVVTNSAILGRSIAEIDFRHSHGVSITRLNRAGVELVPSAQLKLQFGDILTVIGETDNIRLVGAIVGNKSQMLQHAQIIPIFIGIAIGALLGSIPLHVPGMPAPLKLGLAGGPLIAAILLSRIGHIGPLVWFMPPSANMVLREIGIVLFLTVMGIKSGGKFVETLVHGDGLLWMACAALITVVPLLIVGFIARIAKKANYLTVCGLFAGAMTDPPALAFANAIAPSEAPALAYATVYPLVMCLRVLAPQLLVVALW